MKIRLILICLSMLFSFMVFPLKAWELIGTKDIYLQDKSGSKILIGHVDFKPDGNQIAFDIHWNHEKMKDYFLSMREFKCLDGQDEVQCLVPYPYKSPKTVTPSNFAWLEHHTLFLYKEPRNFGANLWNGIYYEFKLTDAGLLGTPNAIDLVSIGAPPDNLEIPPYGKNERSMMPEGARWFKNLSIE